MAGEQTKAGSRIIKRIYIPNITHPSQKKIKKINDSEKERAGGNCFHMSAAHVVQTKWPINIFEGQ